VGDLRLSYPLLEQVEAYLEDVLARWRPARPTTATERWPSSSAGWRRRANALVPSATVSAATSTATYGPAPGTPNQGGGNCGGRLRVETPLCAPSSVVPSASNAPAADLCVYDMSSTQNRWSITLRARALEISFP